MNRNEKYVDPTLDWSFKKMFLTPGHEDILKTFLNYEILIVPQESVQKRADFILMELEKKRKSL